MEPAFRISFTNGICLKFILKETAWRNKIK